MEKAIFFHVGLGKTASTWLQHRIFPRLKGIHYIRPLHYKRSGELIAKQKEDRVLVSRELDRQFEREVRWFTRTFPESRVIVVFRRHDSWISSQYKRHVKNGWSGDLKEFIDLDNNRGLWDRQDLLYYPKLVLLEQCCRYKPLVLFYEELISDPHRFVKRIEDYTGARLSGPIAVRRVHASYSDEQLLVLRSLCRRFFRKAPRGYSAKWKHWLLYRPVWALFHLILYTARILPRHLVPDGPLINPVYLHEVRTAYESDWQKVVAYASENVPSPGWK